MTQSSVRVFIDGDTQPIINATLPAHIMLDTRSLEDGPHTLTIRAQDESGSVGVQSIPFQVSNGPGIVISGLRPQSIQRGNMRFNVDAFSFADPFEPHRAEARMSIPVWVWVMILFVSAWAVWYAARMWDVPAEFAKTPTYSPAPPPAAAAH
jgi:hypothetical protein